MAIKHVVAPGDCLASISYANGFSIDTVWNADANTALRGKRASPFQLVPGDEVTIPDRVPKTLPRPTGARHVFRRHDVPEKVQIKLRDAKQQPRANLAYVLVIDGKRSEGTTGADGGVEAWISPAARSAQLILGDEVYTLATGNLQPETEDAGVYGRLAALGYLLSLEEGEDPLALRDALTSFQTKEKLTVSGQIDDATRAKLRERYGS